MENSLLAQMPSSLNQPYVLDDIETHCNTAKLTLPLYPYAVALFLPLLPLLQHLPCANIKMTKKEVKASRSRCYLERWWTTELRTLSIRKDPRDCSGALWLLTHAAPL